MEIKGRIILIFLSLFSFSIAYSQHAKQKAVAVPPPQPHLYFGKFIPDSVNLAKAAEIASADSLFIKGAPGKVISFDVYTIANKAAITESAFGNRLSKKQKLLIAGIQP